MSFQAYLDNIKVKTGKSTEDFRKLAEKKGLLAPRTKATEIVNWLKQDYDLGHGHAMAIYASFKGFSGKEKPGSNSKKEKTNTKTPAKKTSKQETLFSLKLAQPALRALSGANIKTLKDISKLTEKEFTALHGIGPTATIALKAAMKKEKLSFRK